MCVEIVARNNHHHACDATVLYFNGIFSWPGRSSYVWRPKMSYVASIMQLAHLNEQDFSLSTLSETWSDAIDTLGSGLSNTDLDEEAQWEIKIILTEDGCKELTDGERSLLHFWMEL